MPWIAQKTVRIMAKDLVRTRQYVTKFYEMRSQLQAISLRLEVRSLYTAVAFCMAQILLGAPPDGEVNRSNDLCNGGGHKGDEEHE